MTKRWQRRKDARAPEILEAALACFAQKGFAGTPHGRHRARAPASPRAPSISISTARRAVFKALAAPVDRRAAGRGDRAAGGQLSPAPAPTCCGLCSPPWAISRAPATGWCCRRCCWRKPAIFPSWRNSGARRSSTAGLALFERHHQARHRSAANSATSRRNMRRGSALRRCC